jgi:dynein heavy chain
MRTRRRKGVFGPNDNKTNLFVFIDDLNMPLTEKWGAQPPL